VAFPPFLVAAFFRLIPGQSPRQVRFAGSRFSVSEMLVGYTLVI